MAPSELAFDGYATPTALPVEALAGLVEDWAAAARRAVAAGFEVLELHAAHGYLLHEFLSPLSNHRTDAYGGTLSNRARLLTDITDAVRAAVPSGIPLFVRLSATDWHEGGLTVAEAAEVAASLKAHGVDLIDVSSGGNVAAQQIQVSPGYQVPFATEIHNRSTLPVAAVGMITDPVQAEKILTEDSVDAVLLGRALLREPTWPQRAALELDADLPWPVQYARARP